MYFFFFLYIEQSIHFHYSIQMESIIFFLRKFCTWQTMWNPFLNLIMYKRIHSLCVQFFCCTIHNFRRCSADGRALAVHRVSVRFFTVTLIAGRPQKQNVTLCKVKLRFYCTIWQDIYRFGWFDNFVTKKFQKMKITVFASISWKPLDSPPFLLPPWFLIT